MATTKVSACKQCGVEFAWRWGEMGRRSGCCSDACYSTLCHDKYVAAGGAEKWRGYYKPKEIRPFVCAQCGAGFETNHKRKYCSPRCRGTTQEWKRGNTPPPPTKCLECGSMFQPAQHRNRWCSKSCSQAHRWRISTAKRRARLRGADRENIDPFEIFERDKWRCHICGVRTLKSLRGTRQDRAPELDHILPLSKGGPHTRLNTACACRRCNVAKGDKVLGQLRLVG